MEYMDAYLATWIQYITHTHTSVHLSPVLVGISLSQDLVWISLLLLSFLVQAWAQNSAALDFLIAANNQKPAAGACSVIAAAYPRGSLRYVSIKQYPQYLHLKVY